MFPECLAKPPFCWLRVSRSVVLLYLFFYNSIKTTVEYTRVSAIMKCSFSFDFVSFWTTLQVEVQFIFFHDVAFSHTILQSCCQHWIVNILCVYVDIFLQLKLSAFKFNSVSDSLLYFLIPYSDITVLLWTVLRLLNCSQTRVLGPVVDGNLKSWEIKTMWRSKTLSLV